jgi:hypothetical protein
MGPAKPTMGGIKQPSTANGRVLRKSFECEALGPHRQKATVYPRFIGRATM